MTFLQLETSLISLSRLVRAVSLLRSTSLSFCPTHMELLCSIDLISLGCAFPNSWSEGSVEPIPNLASRTETVGYHHFSILLRKHDAIKWLYWCQSVILSDWLSEHNFKYFVEIRPSTEGTSHVAMPLKSWHSVSKSISLPIWLLGIITLLDSQSYLTSQ